LLNPVHPYTKELIKAVPDPDNILASNGSKDDNDDYSKKIQSKLSKVPKNK
jgi:ABC-type oligopeptide transport system ATPase subunit